MEQPLELEAAPPRKEISGEIIVREAGIEDLEFILRAGKEFHEEAVDHIPFDYRSLAITVHEMISSDSAVVLVALREGEFVGTASAHFYPMFFNHAHRAGQEQWWWVAPAHRRAGVGSALLERLETHARACGAQSFSMIALGGDAAARLYKRAGYKKLQTIFVKIFGG